MKRMIVFISCLIVYMFLNSHSVSGTTGSMTSVGAITAGSAEDTGLREWVELVASGDLLTGRPRHPDIKLITVYAPGIDKGHIILRELKRSDGARELLLTAPANVSRDTRRATLYFKHDTENLKLLELIDGRWETRIPHVINTTGNDHDDPSGKLAAFSVKGIGSYWLVGDNSPAVFSSITSSQNQSAISLMSGDVSRGLMSIGLSLLLMMLGLLISKWINRMKRYANK